MIGPIVAAEGGSIPRAVAQSLGSAYPFAVCRGGTHVRPNLSLGSLGVVPRWITQAACHVKTLVFKPFLRFSSGSLRIAPCVDLHDARRVAQAMNTPGSAAVATGAGGGTSAGDGPGSSGAGAGGGTSGPGWGGGDSGLGAGGTAISGPCGLAGDVAGMSVSSSLA